SSLQNSQSSDSWKLEIERTKFATKLSGRQFEVGDKANSVRISRRGQIWSVKHELLRFASQILSPTFFLAFMLRGSG
ncbi:TPA: hypothetical protein ACU0L0_001318, partial [Streptococcus suis]